MLGNVFKIQKFCVDDGPGIRTTVFLKGCPLRCRWCHNPESYSFVPQLSYEANKCSGCRKCAAACPNGCHLFGTDGVHFIDRDICTACGKCVSVCKSGALKITGEYMEAEEVIAAVLQDQIFYKKSGGGITVSGGEPFAQPEFTKELLKLAKANKIHTCVETSGCVNIDHITECLPYIDLLLWDIKETDPERHRFFTGGSLETILKNLDSVCKTGKPILLRYPVIQGVNDREEHESAVKNISERYENIIGTERMEYHNLGIHKSVSHGLETQQDFSNEHEDGI